MKVIEMTGITSTELKLPRLRKRIWISVLIVALLICVLVLLPPIIILNFQVEWRVNAAVHMLPDAELRYSETTDVSEFMKVKKTIYWINFPYGQVKDYPFVTNYREDSDPIKVNSFIEVTSNYSQRLYFLSDLPQKELDSKLYFALNALRDDPDHLTTIRFYIIDANWGIEDYTISELDYERLAGKETTGTYIVYTYQIS